MDWNTWTPVFTLILGFGLGFVADIIKSNIQLNNTYKEIIFRKRLEEIENILVVIRELNFEGMNDDGKVYPILLADHKNLRSFHISLAKLLKTSCSFWISNDIRAALGKLNQYLYFLHQETKSLNNVELMELGVQIRMDFRDFFFAISSLIKSFINSIPKDKVFELNNEQIQLNGIFNFEENSIFLKMIRSKQNTESE